jgi:hypothetical protein
VKGEDEQFHWDGELDFNVSSCSFQVTLVLQVPTGKPFYASGAVGRVPRGCGLVKDHKNV